METLYSDVGAITYMIYIIRGFKSVAIFREGSLVSIRNLLSGFCAAFVLGIASFTHAGIAFQSYTPAQNPVDYTASTLNLDATVYAGEGGSFIGTTGGWFTFQMPHAASFTGITIPLKFITAPTNTSVNFGFWLGSNPAGSTVGGLNLPLADIVVGQTKEYSFNFAAGYQFAAGQSVTIQINPLATTTASIDAFLSNTAGTTHETGLGQIFDPTPLSSFPAIQIRDNFVEAPEPGSVALLAIGAAAAAARRRRAVLA